jgi:hypothetical protein
METDFGIHLNCAPGGVIEHLPSVHGPWFTPKHCKSEKIK